MPEAINNYADMENIIGELLRSEEKYRDWPESIDVQAGIVCEKSGDLYIKAQHRNYAGANLNDIRKEAIQTAAVCIRFLKNLPKE